MLNRFPVIFGALLYSLFNLVFYASSSAADLSACGHHGYPPWNWHQGNKIVGVCAEVTETLFANVGLKTDLTYVGPWARCQEKIRTGEIDVNICSFINPQRKEYAVFVPTPMGYNEHAVFVKAGAEFPFEQWHDLRRKSAAMVHGVSIGQAFDEFLEQHTFVTRLSSYQQSFKLLELGRVEFVPLGRYTGLAMRDSFQLQGQIVDLPRPILVGKLYISMSKKSPFLHTLTAINQQVQAPGFNQYVLSLMPKYTQMYAQQQTQNLPATQ